MLCGTPSSRPQCSLCEITKSQKLFLAKRVVVGVLIQLERSSTVGFFHGERKVPYVWGVLCVVGAEQSTVLISTCLSKTEFSVAPSGTTEFSIYVNVSSVTVAPNITSRSESEVISAGDSLILDCLATGVPLPTITWFKNGVSQFVCTRGLAISERL